MEHTGGDDVVTLLAGPRGRRLLLEVAAATQADGEFTQSVFFASHRLDPNPGTLLHVSGSEAAAGEEVAAPEVTPADVAALLEGVPLEPVTESALREALAASVESAMYWQEPDGDDVLAATDPMVSAFGRVAAHIAASPLVAWWLSPVASEQWQVTWDFQRRNLPARAQGISGEQWRQVYSAQSERDEAETPPNFLERLADVIVGRGPQVATSGTWWSIPLAFDDDRFYSVSSARTLPTGEPALLTLVEDSFGGDAAWVRLLTPGAGEVFEITSAQDWADLCARFPREVTHSRGPDWGRVTGRTGRWLMPDWPAVAREYAGVHLTVAGYLAAATTAIPVQSGNGDFASVIAGWNPDETYWFCDVDLGEPAVWRRSEATAAEPSAWSYQPLPEPTE